MATKSSLLRDQIRALLHDSPTSVEEDLEALSHCEAQIRNRGLVGHLARECGLALAGFRTNDALELYYDLKRGRHDLGFIAKGWEDPGFRMGDREDPHPDSRRSPEPACAVRLRLRTTGGSHWPIPLRTWSRRTEFWNKRRLS